MKCDQENGEMNGTEKKKWIKKKWKEFKENIGDTEKKSDGEIKDKMKERNESKC